MQANQTQAETSNPASSNWWKEESLAQLNHNLRNSLASIVSALHILKHEGYSSWVAEKACMTIERQAENLAQLADQLSEVAGVPKAAPGKAENGAPASGPHDAGPRRILVVDDNRDAADSTGMLLALWGHQVKVAYDGPSAVELARQYHPDICLLDLGMPGMDGYQVAEKLRQEPELRATRLVALTGFDQESERRSTSEAGFETHLIKPVQLAALQEVLARGSLA